MDLGQLATDCVAMINMEAAKKHTHVSLEKPASPLVVNLDPAKMRQVIDNLLSNAVKFSPPGSAVQAYVSVSAPDKVCQIAVRDQGPGIPEGERDKLFKDFSRLSIRPTAGEKSTGLGLAICRKQIKIRLSKLTKARSTRRIWTEGCEFRVTLPFSQ